MRWLLPLLAACTEEPPSAEAVTSRVSYREIPVYIGNAVDVLFVVDDSAAMAPYQNRIATLARELEQAWSRYNLHLGVTSTGALHTAPSVGGSFVMHTPKTFSSAWTNYEGGLGDATAALLAVGTGGSGPATPLAAIQTAVAAPGFLREYAPLIIITIAATDDASAVGVGDAVSALHALERWAIVASGVYPRPAPRLDEFLGHFDESVYTSIDATDYAAALPTFPVLRTSLGAACVEQEPADVDPETPGPQYDCSVTAVEDGIEHVLPRCASTDEPCWDMIPDPLACTDSTHLRFVARGPFVGSILIRSECVD